MNFVWHRVITKVFIYTQYCYSIKANECNLFSKQSWCFFVHIHLITVLYYTTIFEPSSPAKPLSQHNNIKNLVWVKFYTSYRSSFKFFIRQRQHVQAFILKIDFLTKIKNIRLCLLDYWSALRMKLQRNRSDVRHFFAEVSGLG